MRAHEDEPTRSPVSFVVNVARLPNKGMPVTILADEKQRKALAADHELVGVAFYKADLHVSSWKRNGVRVSGRVNAKVIQECVVSLEPIDANVETEVEALFLPENSKLAREGFGVGGEIIIDAEGDDSPETFSGDSIDIGALSEQFFGLAIDPYPRKPGVELAQPSKDESESGGSLRDQLAALARKPQNG